MAMLHEKEIVLNKHDTENFLDALSILRELNLSMMAQIGHFGMPFSNSQTSILQQLASQPIEQNVTIQAEFPNATDKDEIKEAFNDLINLAT
jgi:dimeric dUTPase (all-alpha-NTP-PPase superfamily)